MTQTGDCLVTITRNIPLPDDAGGYEFTPKTVATGVKATLRRKNRISDFRNELGPGITTLSELFFIFRPPFPALEAGDIITPDGGAAWRVVIARCYSATLQADVELVQ